MEVEPFILFGTDHLLATLALILTSIFLPIFLKKASSKTKNWFGYILASILILNECVKPYYHNHFFGYELLTVLPLHMCTLSAFSISFFLLTKKSIFYEAAFFLGNRWRTNGSSSTRYAIRFPRPCFHNFLFKSWHHVVSHRPRIYCLKK